MSDSITSDSQSVLEREPIIRVFSKPVNVRILTVLVDAAGLPLSVAQIVEQAGVGKQAFYDNKDILLESNLIQQAEKVGNATRYKVEMDTPEIQAFMLLRDCLIDAVNMGENKVS